MALAQRDHDHLDVAVRIGLARHLVLEPEIDDPAHAVVERGLPPGRRETPHVVRAHHHATSRTASRGRFQASEVANVETPVPRQRAAQGVCVLVRSTAPTAPQVDARVAGLEAPQEAADRRVQREPLELVEVEQPVAAHGLVARDDVGERAVELGREDDVDDVLRPEAALRRDRVDDRDRALDRDLVAVLGQPGLLVELALQRLRQALAAPHAAAGQQPVLGAALLVPAEQDPAVPAEDRRDPDARLGSHRGLNGAPTSRSRRRHGRSRSARRVSTTSTAATGTTSSWAMRMPGSTVNALSRSVLSRITRTSPR